MTTVSPRDQHEPTGRFARDGEPETVAAGALEAALERFQAPRQWRALRTHDRLEARWASEAGSWARFSIAIGPVDIAVPEESIVLRREIAGGRLTLVFASSDSEPETVAAGHALVEQIERMTDALA